MITRSTSFPVFAAGYERAESNTSDAPIMLDGMEVLFDKTVGLYPVDLDSGGNESEQRDTGATHAAA